MSLDSTSPSAADALADEPMMKPLAAAIAGAIGRGMHREELADAAECIKFLNLATDPWSYGGLGPWPRAAMLGYRSRDAEVAELRSNSTFYQGLHAESEVACSRLNDRVAKLEDALRKLKEYAHMKEMCTRDCEPETIIEMVDAALTPEAGQ